MLLAVAAMAVSGALLLAGSRTLPADLERIAGGQRPA